MDSRNKIKSSSNWGNFDSDLQRYIMKQLEYLNLRKKGLGIDQNIHVYSDCNGIKENSNLICLLEIDMKNRIMLKSHKANAQITNADKYEELLKSLNIPIKHSVDYTFEIYDLSTYQGILEFDRLIEKISKI